MIKHMTLFTCPECFACASLSLGHDLKHMSSSEKFSEKFKEVKDAARLAREKSQDKELANTALTIAAPQVSKITHVGAAYPVMRFWPRS